MMKNRAFARLSYLYMLLFSLRFTEAFWVIYLKSRGLTFAMIGLLETLFHLAALIGELPTGWIADRLGRKTSLIVGRILAIIAAVLTLRASGPLGFGAAFACSALGYTCHSGAYDALLFDELKRDGRESGFTLLMGKINAVYLVGCSAACLLGGMVAQRHSLALLYVFGIIVDAAAVLLLLPLPESFAPARERGEEVDLRRDLAALVSTMRQPILAGLLLLWAVIAALETSFRFYGQSYMRQALIPLWAVGAVGTLGNLAAVIPTRLAHRLEDRHGSRRPLYLGAVTIPAAVLLAGLMPVGSGPIWRFGLVVLLIAVNVVIEGLYPVFCNAANALIPSERRATVLSAGSMLFSLVMMAVFPLIGLAGDRLGLRRALILAGGLTMAALVCAGSRSMFHSRNN